MTKPVLSLLNRIQKGGLTLHAVHDGVRWEKIPTGSNLSQRKFAAEIINSVVESWVEVKNAAGKTACLFIIPDLSGDEIVADWAGDRTFSDSLSAIVEAHQEYWEAKLHG